MHESKQIKDPVSRVTQQSEGKGTQQFRLEDNRGSMVGQCMRSVSNEKDKHVAQFRKLAVFQKTPKGYIVHAYDIETSEVLKSQLESILKNEFTAEYTKSSIQKVIEEGDYLESRLAHAHDLKQDLRFLQLNISSSVQISEKAPGAHVIPERMMPPPGHNQIWMNTGSEYKLFTQKGFPTVDSIPLTYGDPSNPSLIMNQGNMNKGMFIFPAGNRFTKSLSRNEATYAGIPAETERVRGHPFALKQNQISTDDPKVTFDDDSRTYTSESNSSSEKGGVSSFRYYQIELPAIKTFKPFTQVNVNENATIGEMGITQPSMIYFRNEIDDVAIDNTSTTDYRAPNSTGLRPQANQHEMGKKFAEQNPYPEPQIRKLGDPYKPMERHQFPFYKSPPSSPIIANTMRIVTLEKDYSIDDLIIYENKHWRILRIINPEEKKYEIIPESFIKNRK